MVYFLLKKRGKTWLLFFCILKVHWTGTFYLESWPWIKLLAKSLYLCKSIQYHPWFWFAGGNYICSFLKLIQTYLSKYQSWLEKTKSEKSMDYGVRTHKDYIHPRFKFKSWTQMDTWGFVYKGLVFCRNNGWIMENMEKGITVHQVLC